MPYQTMTVSLPRGNQGKPATSRQHLAGARNLLSDLRTIEVVVKG
jgi:hypothetical protein